MMLRLVSFLLLFMHGGTRLDSSYILTPMPVALVMRCDAMRMLAFFSFFFFLFLVFSFRFNPQRGKEGG